MPPDSLLNKALVEAITGLFHSLPPSFRENAIQRIVRNLSKSKYVAGMTRYLLRRILRTGLVDPSGIKIIEGKKRRHE